MTSAVILAAGRSSRMGTQKLLLPYAGRTVIGHVVYHVRQAPVDQTIIVTGPDHDAVAAALVHQEVTFVRNPGPEADMLSSVRCGLRALPPACEAVLIALGDQPAITMRVISELMSAHRPNDSITVPVYAGRRGHPMLISRAFTQEVLTAHDGVGLRGLLLAHPEKVVEVPVGVPGVLEDIDTPDDYRRLIQKLD